MGTGQLMLLTKTEAYRFQTSDYSLLPPSPLSFARVGNRQLEPAVASNGNDFLVAWIDQQATILGSTERDVYAVRVRGSNGAVLGPPIPLSVTAPDAEFVSVASNGLDYMVVWQELEGANTRIRGTRVRASDSMALDGTPETGGVPLDLSASGGVHYREPVVASDGVNYLVAWLDSSTGY